MVGKQVSILQSIQTRTTTRSLVNPGCDNVTFYMNEKKANTNSNKKQKLFADPWLGKRVRSIFNLREKETSKKCLQRRVKLLLLFLELPKKRLLMSLMIPLHHHQL